MNDDGSQGNGGDSGLTEIPLSHVLQMNQPVFDGSDYKSRPYTDWNIEIYDSSPQIFTINLQGLMDGYEQIWVGGFLKGKSQPKIRLKFNVLVSVGQLRRVNLAFDPNQKTLSYQRVVDNVDLLTDVKITCKLNQISSDHVCDQLERKAKVIQNTLEDHQGDKAEELVKSFLHSLGEGVGDGDNDQDDHNSIKEPALTILKEDAKALLAQIELNEKAHHGDHDHDGNGKF